MMQNTNALQIILTTTQRNGRKINFILFMNKYEKYKDSGVQWLGDIPEHWEIIRFKRLFKEKKKTTDVSLNSGSISFGEVVYKDDEKITEATKLSYQVLNEGEFLLNPLNMNYDLKSLRIGLSTINVVVSSGYIILQSKRGLNKNYYRWLLRMYDIVFMKTLGAGVRQTINYNDLADSHLVVPSFDEQQVIAEFLDDKTAKIDQAIAIKEKEIALLKERRQILIQQAVTKGLDANVPMKDSGIDWIGEIPEHWEVIPNRYIFKQKKVLVGKKSAEYDLLSLTLKGVIKRDMENPEGKFPAEFDTYQEVKYGDFVFCLFDVEETPRTVGLSNFDGMITGAYTVMTVNNLFNKKYLYYYYLSLDEKKKLKYLYKGLRNTIPKDLFFSLKTIIPAEQEQIKIVSYLEAIEEKIAKAISIKEQEIEKLKEYKTVLIDQVVTGKVRVNKIN
jgi:type I restriction enzyme S subunit